MRVCVFPVSMQGEERDGRWQKRPDFILLSPRSPEIDQEGPVLYPDGCEDTVSLAGRYAILLTAA